MKKVALCIVALLLCAGCISLRQEPIIGSIGLSKGTLATPLNALQFQERFTTHDREIVGIVQFDQVSNGTTVQATWFALDHRPAPLGRDSILIESGAKLARFSITSQSDWVPAPYMLDIRAWNGEGEPSMTASGQVQFFIGMSDAEIGAYAQSISERFYP